MTTNTKNGFEWIVRSPDKTNAVRTMFRDIAPRYDVMNRIMSLGRDITWRRLAVQKAGFIKAGRIIDLGTGTGDVAREIFRLNGAHRIYGVDNCHELMELGRRKAGLESMIWISGDGRQLPFPDDSVDGIIAAFSIRNMANLNSVFPEMYRVLRKGGKIVVLDMVRPLNAFYRAIYRLQFRFIVPLLGRWLGSAPGAYHYLLPSIENFYSFGELNEVLKNLGCKLDDSRELMFKTVALCIGTK